MSSADSVGQKLPDSFGTFAIASVTGASLATSGNAVIAIPILSGGLTAGNAASTSGQVIIRRITVQNANSDVSTGNIAVTISSAGSVAAANAVVANVVLSNLTTGQRWQDLTIAGGFAANTTINGFTNQCLFVNVNTAVASGTVDIRVYGDTVSF
jgi:hypothetical protein